MMRWFELSLSFSLVLLVATVVVGDTAKQVSFEQSAQEIDAFDFVEVTIKAAGSTVKNPFWDVAVTGQFQEGNGSPSKVEGFCDSPDGSLYRIRFMPTKPGRYFYTVQFRQGDRPQTHSGKFSSRDAKRRGLVRIDKEHPWHFVWQGTGEHYFWNGTTTYWLLGWQDEDVIRQAIDRLARLKVNRLRVALCGRTKSGNRWYEPLVVNTDKFQFRLNPWIAQRPDSVERPGFDVTRYNVPFWQKCERMLRHAREKGMVVSIIFYLDGKDPGVDPFGKGRMGCEDEQRYYRYALARLAAFSNVMWDVANEYHLFRDEPWTEKMGTLIETYDPYKHLTSVHGHGDFKFRTSPWADFAMYQSWDGGGSHDFLLKHRQTQAKTGRPMPQVNEEYGYEDHYPGKWGGGKKAPARSADNRRRLAWGMYVAGGYQTTGERADRGTGNGADSGGSWINGRGDDTMTMLGGYGHIVTCFTSLRWWRMEPRDDLVDHGTYCLAEPGQQYLVYLPSGGKVEVKLDDGKYQAQWFNPRNGKWTTIGSASGPKWTSPKSPDDGDWAVVLRRGLAPPEAVTDERTEMARTLVAQMASGQFDKGTEPFDQTMKRVLPANKLKQVWDGVIRQYGPLRRTTEARTETIQKYKAVFVTCEFQRGPLDVKVVFNSDNKIAGLFFAPSGKYRRPGYANPSKFDEEEVTVGKGLLTLSGTLSLPKGDGPFPALVLVHGSGPHDRDEAIGPNKPFRDLAHGLASRRIAVLRYEKRTKQHPIMMALVSSSITVKEETVDDAVAAVETLAGHKRIDPKRIFVLGHSLGGTLIPRIGNAKDTIAGFISLAGSTRPMEDLMLEQTKYIVSLAGKLTEEEQKKVRELEQQIARVKSPDLSATTPKSKLPLGVPASYWLDLREYEPAKEATSLRKPLLILQGERDYQVTMEDFANWRKALASRKDVKFIAYPNLNHLFMEGEGKSTPAEYSRAGNVAASVIDDIVRWMESR